MNRKIKKFIKKTCPEKNKLFIKALKVLGIKLGYGSNCGSPVIIIYTKKDCMRLDKEVLDACKNISLNEWNNI